MPEGGEDVKYFDEETGEKISETDSLDREKDQLGRVDLIDVGKLRDATAGEVIPGGIYGVKAQVDSALSPNLFGASFEGTEMRKGRAAYGLKMLGQTLNIAMEQPPMGRLSVVSAYDVETVADVEFDDEVLGDRLSPLNAWANSERLFPAVAVNELYKLFKSKDVSEGEGLLGNYSSQYSILKRADEVLAGVQERNSSHAFLDLESEIEEAKKLKRSFRLYWERKQQLYPCLYPLFDGSGEFLSEFVDLGIKCPRSYGEDGDDLRLKEFDLGKEDASAENLLKYMLMVSTISQVAFEINDEYLYRCSHSLIQAMAWLYWNYRDHKVASDSEEKFVSFSAELVEGFSKEEKIKYLNSLLSLIVSDKFVVTADVLFRDLEKLVDSDPDLSEYKELMNSLHLAFGVQSHVFVHLNPEAGKLPEDFHSLRDSLVDLNKEIEKVVQRKAIVLSVGHGDGIVEKVLAKDGLAETVIGIDIDLESEVDSNETEDVFEVVVEVKEKVEEVVLIEITEDDEIVEDENEENVEDKEVKYVAKNEGEGRVMLWKLGVKGLSNEEIQERIFDKAKEVLKKSHPELADVDFAPDMVIFNDSLHHIKPGKEKGGRFNYIRAAYEMLRKGGVLRIADPVHSVAKDKLSQLSVNPFDSSAYSLMSLEDFSNVVGYLEKRGGKMESSQIVPSSQAGKGDSYYRIFLNIRRGGDYEQNLDKNLPYTFEAEPENEEIESFDDIFTIFPFNLLSSSKQRLRKIVSIYMGEEKWKGIKKCDFRKEFIAAAIRYHMFRASWGGEEKVCEDFRAQGRKVTGIIKKLSPGTIQYLAQEIGFGSLPLADYYDSEEITRQIIENKSPYVSFLPRLMEIVGEDELMIRRNSLAGEVRAVRDILEMELRFEGDNYSQMLTLDFSDVEGWVPESY